MFPHDYIIEQIKRFKSEKEDSLIEQHSSLKTENEELTTNYKDLQFDFKLFENVKNILKNWQAIFLLPLRKCKRSKRLANLEPVDDTYLNLWCENRLKDEYVIVRREDESTNSEIRMS